MPGATLVTGTATPDVLAATDTEAGTVATPGLLELRLKIKPPAGAADESVSDRLCVTPLPAIVKFAGTKLCAKPTSTTSVSPIRPDPDAEMLADPAATPVS